LTIGKGRFTVRRARLAPAMISTPGHRASRRRVEHRNFAIEDDPRGPACELKLSAIFAADVRQDEVGTFHGIWMF
jgi:hypothetical protein